MSQNWDCRDCDELPRGRGCGSRIQVFEKAPAGLCERRPIARSRLSAPQSRTLDLRPQARYTPSAWRCRRR